MTDRIEPEKRSANMRAIRAKDTKPELTVRRLIHGLGYRYRLHRQNLPGRPDLIFPARRKVIFVHGCFWHQHEDPACPIAHKPRSNLPYWEPKLQRTKNRDEANTRALKEMGWDVLTVWECSLKPANKEGLKEAIVNFLGPRPSV